MDLVIFDIETTGLSPRANEIIQIAAVRIDLQKEGIEERFDTFVNAGQTIPSAITALTGISNQHVRNAPGPVDALRQFAKFSGLSVLVAHNGRRFDTRFIHETCLRHRVPTREIRFLDSLDLSKRLWRQERLHNMDIVAQRLGISGEGWQRHDARGDVLVLAEATRRMWQRLCVGDQHETFPVPLGVGHLPV